MKTQVMLVAAVAAACTLPAIAQSGGGTSDTLSALLVEVRALRVAIERAASTAPEIQLLAARIAVQNERVTRAARDADAAHQELDKLLAEASGVTARVAQLEEAVSRETEPERVKNLKAEQLNLKSALDGYPAQETRLRARDSEFANLVTVEQAQWVELNRRLDDLERELAGRRPQ
jgi:chromosome segregation ATPase